MTTLAPSLPSPSTSARVRQLAETVRWAPAPRWGRTASEHGRYVAYLGGSMVAWTLIGLGAAAGLGQLLSLG